MKEIIFSILFFTIFLANSFSQMNKQSKSEILFGEVEQLEKKAEHILSKALLFQIMGSNYIDSARFVSVHLQNAKSNAEANMYMKIFDNFYMLAYSYIAQGDSLAILADNYTETATLKKTQAFNMLGMSYTPPQPKSKETHYHNTSSKTEEKIIIEDSVNEIVTIEETFVPNIDKKNSFRNEKREATLYVIQLGAGNMQLSYFDKVPNIKMVNCKDGIKRFIIDDYFDKKTAQQKFDELTQLGYKQVFIRTKSSMDKLIN